MISSILMRHSSHKREHNTFICASLQVISTTLNVNRDNTQKSCCIIRGFEEEGKTRRKTILWSHTRTGWTDLRQKAFWRAVLERAGPRKDHEVVETTCAWMMRWEIARWNHQSKLPTHTFSSNSERRRRLPLKLEIHTALSQGHCTVCWLEWNWQGPPCW